MRLRFDCGATAVRLRWGCGSFAVPMVAVRLRSTVKRPQENESWLVYDAYRSFPIGLKLNGKFLQTGNCYVNGRYVNEHYTGGTLEKYSLN